MSDQTNVPTVIGLSGYARSGKDSAAKTLIELGYERISFADQVRELALRLNPALGPWTLSGLVGLYGWENAKDTFSVVREYLQLLGTSVREVIGEDAWVDAAFSKMERGKKYVFTDVRFPNEAAAIADELQGELWRIARPGVGAVNNHISEIGLDNWTFDKIIVNEGTLGNLANTVRYALSR